MWSPLNLRIKIKISFYHFSYSPYKIFPSRILKQYANKKNIYEKEESVIAFFPDILGIPCIRTFNEKTID